MRTRFIGFGAFVLFSVAASGQEPYEAFMTKFEEAVKTDNYAQMKELVVKNQPFIQDGYFLYETQLLSAVANQAEEDKAARLAVLDKLVNLALQEAKDRFPSDRLTWAKTLTQEQAGKRLELTQLIDEGATAFRQAEKTGEKADFQKAREKFVKAAPIAKAIGDVYWQIDTDVWLAGAGEKMEERFEAAYHYKRAFETARDTKYVQYSYLGRYNLPGKIKHVSRDGLRDDLIDVGIPVEESKAKYKETLDRLAAEALNPGGAESKPGDGAGAGAGGGAKGPMPSAMPPPANKHTKRIEWADADKSKVKEAVGRPVPTPNVGANGHWINWYSARIAPGAPSKTTVVPGENALKNDKGKLLFDPDGSGKAAEERLKVQEGKAEVVVFKNREHADGTKADVRHRLMQQPRSFNINGISLNLKAGSPAEATMDLRWQGATAVQTKFDGWDITIYDDSCNGDFSNYGEDSIVMSKAGVVRSIPLSRYLYIGDLLFEMKLDSSGQNVRFKPYDGPIALLQFHYVATAMPQFMVLEGLNENAQAFFNLMECKDKPMWVPPGEYKFRDGYFMFGEGEKRETITVRNTRCAQFRVAEGKLNKVEMGGAKEPGFTYAWKSELSKDKNGKTLITIPGKDIQVFGCAGEEYVLFLTGVVRPHVKLRSGKDGPTVFDKQMKAPAGEDLNSQTAWDVTVFSPRSLEAEKTFSGDAFVQLEGEYPKLGKITSTPQQVQ